MAVTDPSSTRKYQHKYAFRLRIDGVVVANFAKCSELSAEIEKILIREGGGTVADHALGLVTIPDLTLERGAVTADRDLYNLFSRAVNLVADQGSNEEDVKFNMDIIVLDRAKNREMAWACYDCLPVQFTAGEWDNTASEITTTMLKVAVRAWEPIYT